MIYEPTYAIPVYQWGDRIACRFNQIQDELDWLYKNVEDAYYLQHRERLDRPMPRVAFEVAFDLPGQLGYCHTMEDAELWCAERFPSVHYMIESAANRFFVLFWDDKAAFEFKMSWG